MVIINKYDSYNESFITGIIEKSIINKKKNKIEKIQWVDSKTSDLRNQIKNNLAILWYFKFEKNYDIKKFVSL